MNLQFSGAGIGGGQGLGSILTAIYPLLAAMPRFGAAFLVLPLLTRATVPRQLRIGFLIVLAGFAYPRMELSMAHVEWNMAEWMGFTVKEVLIGALVGYGAGMILWVLASVGDLIDLQAGYNNAQIFDPFGGHPRGPLSILLTQFGALLFVTLGGLQVFLQLIYESLLLWPPASFTPDLGHAFSTFGVATSGSLLENATRLAAPVIAALLLIELGVGLVNRVAPQLQAFYFSLPLKAVAALLVLALLLAHLVDVTRDSFRDSASLLPRLNQALRLQ